MRVIGQRSIGLDGKVFTDRRSNGRRRVLKGATISFNRGFSSFECIVRNESDEGARLSFGETFALPNRFVISIAGDGSREAEVRWRNATQVGIAFI